MALETGTTISALNASNPVAADGLAQADDHIRLIKNVLKTTFPAVNGVLAASHTTLDAAVTATSAGATALAEAGPMFFTDTDTGISHSAANTVGLKAGGTDIAVATTTGLAITGTVTPSGQIVSAAGTVGAPSIAFTAELDCGFYKIGAANFGFAINGTKLLDLSAGAVGITGTLTPTTLGACALTGTYTGAFTLGGIVTFSAAPVFSAGGSFGTGTWAGAATFSGNLTLSGANTYSGTAAFTNAAGIAARNTSKAYGSTSAGALSTGSFNIASVADQGGGIMRFTFTNAFPNALYTCIPSLYSTNARMVVVEARTTTYVDVKSYNTSGSGNDPTVGYGIDCYYNS